MARWIVKGGINQEIQVKICGALLLYSKEGWIIMTGAGLPEVESSNYQG